MAHIIEQFKSKSLDLVIATLKESNCHQNLGFTVSLIYAFTLFFPQWSLGHDFDLPDWVMFLTKSSTLPESWAKLMAQEFICLSLEVVWLGLLWDQPYSYHKDWKLVRGSSPKENWADVTRSGKEVRQ